MAIGGDKQTLPRFPPGALLLWKGRDWNKVAGMLEAWRALPGDHVTAQVTSGGTILSAQPGGGGGDCFGFALSLEGGDVRVSPATLFNALPDGFDPVDGKLFPGPSAGSIYARVEASDGEITSREVLIGTPPASETGLAIEIIGHFDGEEVEQYRCGNIGGLVCGAEIIIW